MCSGDYQRGRPTTGGSYVWIILGSTCCLNILGNISSPPPKKNGQHGRPMTGLSHRYTCLCCYASPSSLSLSCCCLFVCLWGCGFFPCMVVVDSTMSKYISPWHLSLLCSICTLMRSQQFATRSTNVGDLRLVSK